MLFGPSGGGKSTLLRTLNRLNDLADLRLQGGQVWLDGVDILDPAINVIDLRRKVGMVFSRPALLPLSIYDNIVYGLRRGRRAEQGAPGSNGGTGPAPGGAVG